MKAQLCTGWKPVPHVMHLKHHLYELAVTNPLAMAGFLAAVHGKDPKSLREDFSGTAALARGWLQLAHELNLPGSNQIGRDASAAAVDFNRAVLKQIPKVPNFRVFASDVMKCRHKADIIAATNFPVCYFHNRPDLIRYLKHARSCLSPRGIFACDLFGGQDAFTPGTTRIKVPTSPLSAQKSLAKIRESKHSDKAPCGSTRRTSPLGGWFWYEWHQRECYPLTSRVLCDINFELPPRTVFNSTNTALRIGKAFTYDWRLWSIPEMRDAMLEAGFRKVKIYKTLAAGVDSDNTLYVLPMQDDDELTDPYVVYVVAR